VEFLAHSPRIVTHPHLAPAVRGEREPLRREGIDKFVGNEQCPPAAGGERLRGRIVPRRHRPPETAALPFAQDRRHLDEVITHRAPPPPAERPENGRGEFAVASPDFDEVDRPAPAVVRDLAADPPGHGAAEPR